MGEFDCTHKHPATLVNDQHHIQPQAWGGKSVPENMADICPNVHRMAHTLLNIYKKLAAEPGWDVRKGFPAQVRKLADAGWRATLAHLRSQLSAFDREPLRDKLRALPDL